MRNEPHEQPENHERNTFIERHLPAIQAIARQLSDDSTDIEDLTNEGVVYLLEYFANKSYKTHPVNLRKKLRQRILLHLSQITEKQDEEKMNQDLFPDALQQPKQNNPFEEICLDQRRQAVNELLNRVCKGRKLNQIIRDRYGCNTINSPNESGRIIFDDESHTAKEICIWRDVSNASIHELLAKGLIKLREKRRITNLPDYIDWETPQIIDTDDFGIGYANIDGQYIKVIDIYQQHLAVERVSYFDPQDSAKAFSKFVEFLESEGVERFKNMTPIGFSNGTKSSCFIRHSDYLEYVDKFKLLDKK